MRIVVNKCYGGFGLSKSAMEKLGIEDEYDIERTDKALIAIVEEDSASASRRYAKLVVVEIPDESSDWAIMENDGLEEVVFVVGGKLHWR